MTLYVIRYKMRIIYVNFFKYVMHDPSAKDMSELKIIQIATPQLIDHVQFMYVEHFYLTINYLLYLRTYDC